MFNNLKEKRKNVGLTQYKLADLVGLTQSQISKTENGKRNLKNAETIKIAKALNISPEELFFSDEKEG
ncbi:helix-turn-helix domain-containing protein [Clostridium luticellarii]|jgi:transcriptional regulator with XRE-family HTH domain|uniref:helix-turn-helix domain-containing protein n=1 Tax=Clostridium luticellarii TaxID=1691940 RepID=UPI002356B0DA|nr:helix-turn-helix transcriptional regulator [Clostridium luticellarii]MCI1945596.1 helix-turn-helix transcriptional regulator [Clostridium luticellarii]